MKLFVCYVFYFWCVFFIACSGADDIPENIRQDFPEALTITVRNTLDETRADAAVMLDIDRLKKKISVFNPRACIVWSGGEELPSQFVNSEDAKIILVADFSPHEKKRLKLCYRQAGDAQRHYPKRTQAELSHKVGGRFVNRVYRGGTFQNVSFLRVPPEHTDHSFFIRYEGPGWESDKVGYRYYLDWRNAIDVFGKRTPEMVLQDVGQDGFDSYHEMSDWGMDVLKVGDALGIGSVGMWLDGKARRVSVTDSVVCRIVADGPVYSQIRTSYYGWEVGSGRYDLISDLMITAGSRITWHSLEIRGDPANLCTGLVKLEDTTLIRSNAEDGWAYLASWGKQSLAGDHLGMAIFYRTDDLIRDIEDDLNHVVVLKPSAGRLMYGFAAAWEQEPGGITKEEAFRAYLESTLESLNSSLIISY